MTEHSGEATVLKGGLYWRQSLWNARKCVPAILATDGQWLTLSDGEGKVAFSVPCTQAQAKFSSLSTLTITANGTKYALVGKPANLSPRFTDAQLAELAASANTVSNAGNTSLTWLAAVSPVAGGAGAIFDMRNMARNIKPWRDILPKVGVRVA